MKQKTTYNKGNTIIGWIGNVCYCEEYIRYMLVAGRFKFNKKKSRIGMSWLS